MKKTAAALVIVLAACAPNPADEVPKARVDESAQTAPAPVAANKDVETVTYVVSPDSKIEFVGSKVTGSHTGGFSKFKGRVTLAGERLHGAGNAVMIDMRSLYSDNDKLTGHLKSADFFDVDAHPSAKFDILGYDAKGGESYELVGELTLRGAKKRIVFPAKIVRDGENAKLTADFSIKRSDFGIVYPGRPDDLIRDEVVIKLDVRLAPYA